MTTADYNGSTHDFMDDIVPPWRMMSKLILDSLRERSGFYPERFTVNTGMVTYSGKKFQRNEQPFFTHTAL